MNSVKRMMIDEIMVLQDQILRMNPNFWTYSVEELLKLELVTLSSRQLRLIGVLKTCRPTLIPRGSNNA